MVDKIETHKNRTYIENLRNDPRTKAVFDSFVHQACMKVERWRDPHSNPYRAMHEAAQEAVALAMAFVLDEDREYRMVCEQRDQLLKNSLTLLEMQPTPAFKVERNG